MKPIVLFFCLVFSFGFFMCCSGAKNQVEISKSKTQYFRPQASTTLLKGDQVHFEVWVDNHKWEIFDSSDTVFVDFKNLLGSQGTGLSHVLRHHSGDSMAIIQQINTHADFEILHQTLSKSLEQGKGRIISEDIRTVNGSDILFVKWKENLGTSKIVWLSYYLSNTSGHMRLAGGTTEDLLAEYESDIFDLLNGLADAKLKVSPNITADEDIERKPFKYNGLLKKGLIN